MNYSCSFNGNCEANPSGGYTSLEECQANCDSVLFADLLYIIMSYSPEEALRLAPSDMIRVAKNITGGQHTAFSARYLLQALKEDDIFKLINYPSLDTYILKLVGIDPENLEEASRFITKLRTDTGYYPASSTLGDLDYNPSISQKERVKIRFLLHYPVMYELLKERYDNELLGELLSEEVSSVATIPTLELLQSLDVNDEEALQRAYRAMYIVADDEHEVDVMQLLDELIEHDDYENGDEGDQYDQEYEEY